MISIIKGCNVYAPKHLGIKDVVIAGGKIEGIYENLNIKIAPIDVEVIDGRNKLLFPGFIDGHVHIIGAGGEGGYNTRTPEMPLSSLIKAGITTVVGCIGTDGTCRSMKSLIAKAKALKQDGMSAYCFTGSYELPVKTVTDSIKSDLMLIEEIIGIGEIAISDHRSSQQTFEVFANAVAESRVGGLLSNKCGIVNIHLGEGNRKLNYLFELLDKTEIPETQLLPTHINRNGKLFKEGLEYVKRGGFIDLTTSCDLENLGEGELRAGEGLKKYLDEKLPIDHITFTSDGNGSMEKFDKDGKLEGYEICSVSTLYREIKYAITEQNVPIEDAIKVVTSNVAAIMKLANKGAIESAKDADLVIVDEKSLDIEMVFANGKKMMENGEVIVKGFFEK
ncbi:beta-aspartyl-peptidase [Clostridium beijerinckii]|uniref:Isoaspartyl dipeptidase n=1 Tax=Clostridium beijerinckii TaxID=1520 RepID=A0A9Q5CMF1_CLOBE|nr:beta-aspartyl-peptidase [Clostridium beijerinckii]AQS02853.1 isoaspartyl dipeptidase [Clostridium beijerinckii]MBA2886412.1 beta-aspartyl-dipeptidase (metallo-type) [Clostridium beijerinckii]MBA2901146.1 beta-aspartyl-dipeptidase (metallo-type) [Clostridium beijerinckii]MBA2910971.1 beta-aspartyl-dipeptidase (metallo-type) [Clostridium beijerinckii]MBA9017614.1 beta-aspartyl-dipeptidase (metallo-type) [Clostridium beijerinckii]